MLEIMRGWCDYELRDLNDAHERAVVCGVADEDVRQGVQTIVLAESLEISAKKAQAVYERGQWPRFFFTKGGKGGIARKTYLENVGGKLPTNFWPFAEAGHTDEAKKEMLAIFDGKATFDTPKPRRLIEFVLKIAGNGNALILDSFAGSATTAHAVLNMNNDPAHGVSGILFTVDYFDREPLGFRRHNSLMATRFAVKPIYKPGSGDKLPHCPVIYLGLSRLVPFGEFQNDSASAGIRKSLPMQYQEEITALYKSFTHYSISYTSTQQMGDLKTRAEFSSDKEGIDSNTISAGEDNLYVILAALVSLKYYYESITSTKTVESVLLIDEIDATLHPAFQLKLLKLMREYSERYKIQIIFTTHSMSTLEAGIKLIQIKPSQ